MIFRIFSICKVNCKLHFYVTNISRALEYFGFKGFHSKFEQQVQKLFTENLPKVRMLVHHMVTPSIEVASIHLGGEK